MRLTALGMVILLAGCIGGDPQDGVRPGPGNGLTGPPEPAGPPLRFGGTLVDARTGGTLTNASVRIDLAQVVPCGRQGIGWTSWEAPYADGRFGPVEVPRPRSDDVAFFLHATAPGYAENATMIGPAEAQGDIGNLTFVMHEERAVTGQAPPGTLIALDGPRFPRLAVADANGTFVFERARVVDATLVADTSPPFRVTVAAPANVTIPTDAANASSWRLEGTVKSPSGAPLAADLVAFHGTALVGVARTAPGGLFVLPLAAEPASLTLVVRTADGRYGASVPHEIDGPPALRKAIVAQPLC